METFHAYLPEDIILSNLGETSMRYAHILEQELAHLADLAKELIDPPTDPTIESSALPDFHLPNISADSADVLPQNRTILARLQRIHEIEKQTILCNEIQKVLREHGMDFSASYFAEDETESTDQHPRIVYQKNNYTDTAFLQFASLFASPHAVYSQSFLSACEDVYNGICEYCILPLENTSEGRLIGFIKLIDKFSLRINAICNVSAANGERSTQFALLSKRISMEPTNSSERFLEIVFRPSDDFTVCNLLLAAQLCNLSLYRMDSLPDSECENGYLFHITMQASKESNLSTFLLYLFMEIPQHRLVGFYQLLSQNKNN